MAPHSPWEFGAFFPHDLFSASAKRPTFPANAKAIGYWFPRYERSLASAIFDSAAKFASVIGVVTIRLFILHFGWRWSFAATGILSFLYFLAFYIWYGDPQDDPKLSPKDREYLIKGGAQTKLAAEERGGAPLSYLLTQKKILGLAIGFAAIVIIFIYF